MYQYFFHPMVTDKKIIEIHKQFDNRCIEKGKPGQPTENPFEIQVGKDKEDLTWLL